jgi:hypothetical protein
MADVPVADLDWARKDTQRISIMLSSSNLIGSARIVLESRTPSGRTDKEG